MQLRINQASTNCSVYLNDESEIILQGTQKARWFKRKLTLYDNQNILRLQIENSFRLDFWNMNFHILIPHLDLDTYLRPIRLFKGHWQLMDKDNRYDLYLHLGHKKSLFKNGMQIAAYDKQKIQFYDKNTFLIECNDNENIELVLSIVLCFDLWKNDDGSTFTFDFGNLSRGVKDFDSNWKPYYKK